MLPRINDELRTTTCDLGLFNLDAKSSGDESSNTDSNEFAIGQNFIRKYGLLMRYVVRAGSNEVSLSIFIGDAE